MDQKHHDSLKPHQFDGIKEYDNRLPRWWLGTFFLTILFAALYWFYYHTVHQGPTQVEEYDIAKREHDAVMAAHETQELQFDDAHATALIANVSAMAEAKTVFATHCAACHGAQGQGVIGPNLVDAAWLHGGKPNQLFHTIEHGIPAKGMPKWHGALSTDKIQKVTAYVLSLQGSNPPNAKAPQGVVAE